MTLRIFLGILIFITYLQGFAQDKGIVKGKILDSLSSKPLGYTTIAIYSILENKLVNGNISNDEDDFTIDVRY